MNNKNNESLTSVCGNKTIIIEIEIIKLLVITIMIITVIMIIISVYKALWKWCKVGNREMKYGMCKKNLKKKKKLKC